MFFVLLGNMLVSDQFYGESFESLATFFLYAALQENSNNRGDIILKYV